MLRLDREAENAVRQRLGILEADAFLARLEQLSFDIAGPLEQVYGSVIDTTRFAADLVLDALDAAAERPALLRLLDRRREIDPAWFQRSRMIGYVCYADRFGGSLRGVRQHLDYLDELGVTYLHLMPLLRPRDGDSDGGYAVADYGAVDPRVGSMADLEVLAAELHGRGIALCIDLVLNHTAREHEWARKAEAGDPACRGMYLIYPDRTMPDAYEATLPEVFPDTAPGSFTEVPGLGWVWTTFHDYQWDLNYANPAVFRQMLATMLTLANRGVDVLRLDAAPFLWKRPGTDCQNQPEAHLLLQAFRALTRLAAPGLVLKAEAIVGPDMLVQYLGAHDRYQPECDLAYDNQLMVMLWSTLATRDVRLAELALSRRRPAPATDRVGFLPALSRRHRLGRLRRGRGRRRARRFRAPPVPQRVLRRPVPRVLRARCTVPGEPGDRGRPDLGHGRLAVRYRERGRGRGRGRADPGPAAAGVHVCGGVLVRRHPAHLHGRRAGHAERSRVGG